MGQRRSLLARASGWLAALGQGVRSRRPLLARLWAALTPGGAVPDEELLRRARTAGPEGKAAFGELVRRHQAWLVRYLYFLLGGAPEAEDIAQESLVRAYLALDRFRGESGFRTWMRPIATRLAFNHRRDSATRQRYEDLLEAPEYEVGDELGVVSRDTLIKVLGELAYPYREILVLRYIEELSIDDVSETLQIGISAAKMRLSRARDGFWETYRRMATDGPP